LGLELIIIRSNFYVLILFRGKANQFPSLLTLFLSNQRVRQCIVRAG